jgi:hypothetical protein
MILNLLHHVVAVSAFKYGADRVRVDRICKLSAGFKWVLLKREALTR